MYSVKSSSDYLLSKSITHSEANPKICIALCMWGSKPFWEAEIKSPMMQIDLTLTDQSTFWS